MKENLCRIIEYLNKNINEKISIDDLSKKFNYDRFYLMHLFKKQFNITIIDYLNKIRIYNSLNDLKKEKSILNVALNNGFISQEYYTETFKNILGINPSQYRSILKNNKSNYNTNEIINKLIAIQELKEKINQFCILNKKVEAISLKLK